MSEFNAQQLANTAWAFATASQSDETLFAALSRAAEQRVSEFNGQSLANIAWAFVTAGQSDAAVFAASARAVEQQVGEFTPWDFLGGL